MFLSTVRYVALLPTHLSVNIRQSTWACAPFPVVTFAGPEAERRRVPAPQAFSQVRVRKQASCPRGVGAAERGEAREALRDLEGGEPSIDKLPQQRAVRVSAVDAQDASARSQHLEHLDEPGRLSVVKVRLQPSAEWPDERHDQAVVTARDLAHALRRARQAPSA